MAAGGFDIVISRDELDKKLARLRDPELFNQVVTTAFERALATAKKLTPGSGNVRKEWLTEFVKDPAGRTKEAILRNNYKNQDVLRYLEFGTRAHKIKAAPGKHLVFFWAAKNKWVRAKSVKHPGTKPYEILRTTETYLKQQIELLKAKYISAVVAGGSAV